MSIQHIENQTLVALDQSLDARITKTKKKVEFTIDKTEENIVKMKKPMIDEEFSSSTDQEDDDDDEKNTSKRRTKRTNKVE